MATYALWSNKKIYQTVFSRKIGAFSGAMQMAMVGVQNALNQHVLHLLKVLLVL